jgi:hypothetical protein
VVGSGDDAITGATQQPSRLGFPPLSAADTAVGSPPKHGSLLGPSNALAKSVAVEEGPRNLSPFVVDLDKDVSNLPIDDSKVPKDSVALLEILELRGFPTEPEMLPGAIVAEGGKPLRLVLRAAEPRVEIRLAISGERRNRMLSIRPAIVDGGEDGAAMTFTNDRVNTMMAKLPGELAAARQKFNGITADCQGLQLEITRLSNIPLNNATEAAGRDYAVRQALERLRRLTIQRANLEHAGERLERRAAQLPALVALRSRIDRVAVIRFRIYADIGAHQVELLEKAPTATP